MELPYSQSIKDKAGLVARALIEVWQKMFRFVLLVHLIHGVYQT